MFAPDFLNIADVIQIHVDQIERYGGVHGIRDAGMLESAVYQPQSGFGNDFFHKDLYEMAAAYAYHIACNHPFVDGNKRAGLASALLFLKLNEISILDPDGVLEAAMLKVASGEMDKYEFAAVLRALPREE